jgi:glycosyltransferase involved in cell wall biosynthesis
MGQEPNVPVSVIVPNYNSGAYLRPCIESINRGTRPHEIIIVDDCSSDESLALAHRLSVEYVNIRVLERAANGGAAEARRTGLLNASNDLIAFVDADDYLDDDAVLDGYERIAETGADICIWERWVLENGSERDYEQTPSSFPQTGAAATLLTLGGWKIHPWGVSRKSIYLAAYENFHETIVNADELLTRLVFQRAKSVVGSRKRYVHRAHNASTMQQFNPRRLTYLRSLVWLLKFAENVSGAPKRKMALDAIYTLSYYWPDRKRFGEKETAREMLTVAPQIFALSWTWLWRHPKYFAYIGYLIAHAWILEIVIGSSQRAARTSSI